MTIVEYDSEKALLQPWSLSNTITEWLQQSFSAPTLHISTQVAKQWSIILFSLLCNKVLKQVFTSYSRTARLSTSKVLPVLNNIFFAETSQRDRVFIWSANHALITGQLWQHRPESDIVFLCHLEQGGKRKPKSRKQNEGIYCSRLILSEKMQDLDTVFYPNLDLLPDKQNTNTNLQIAENSIPMWSVKGGSPSLSKLSWSIMFSI